ncbi:MAG: acyl-CoA dehydrogenase family protein, partial [Gammaproteobacteria bacterium]|nr:acyl-CoA dehydrogenase family protein [Gammaproteobacteria bacterium]
MSVTYPSLRFAHGETLDQLREQVQNFTRREITPIAAQVDRDNQFPNALWPKFGELGLLGMTVGEEYGGVDMGYL